METLQFHVTFPGDGARRILACEEFLRGRLGDRYSNWDVVPLRGDRLRLSFRTKSDLQACAPAIAKLEKMKGDED